MLITGLWVLFVLGVLAVAVSAHVTAHVELARRLSGRSRCYYAARAGVERAIAVVNADTNGWDAYSEEWGDQPDLFREIPCGDGRVWFTVGHTIVRGDGSVVTNYGLADEQARVDLNEAGVDLLRALFEEVGGMEAGAAARLAQEIADFRIPETEQAGRRTSVFGGNDLRPGRFDSIYELLALENVPGDAFERLRGYITVHGGTRVNINTASRPVLMAVARRAVREVSRVSGEQVVDKVVRFREAGQAFTHPQRVVEELGRFAPLTPEEQAVLRRMVTVLTTRSDCFRGTVRGSGRDEPGLSREITFVWDRKEAKIRFWHED